jgi:hypothetical protein
MSTPFRPTVVHLNSAIFWNNSPDGCKSTLLDPGFVTSPTALISSLGSVRRHLRSQRDKNGEQSRGCTLL